MSFGEMLPATVLQRKAVVYVRHNSVWKIMSEWLHFYRD